MVVRNAKPNSPCRSPGCPEVCSTPYCEAHADTEEAWQHHSGLSAAQRGYGHPWRRLRARVLARDHGLCQICDHNGFVTPGNIVDHIVPKAEGGTDAMDNLQVLCPECNATKTATEAARGRQRAQGRGVSIPGGAAPMTVVPSVQKTKRVSATL